MEGPLLLLDQKQHARLHWRTSMAHCSPPPCVCVFVLENCESSPPTPTRCIFKSSNGWGILAITRPIFSPSFVRFFQVKGGYDTQDRIFWNNLWIENEDFFSYSNHLSLRLRYIFKIIEREIVCAKSLNNKSNLWLIRIKISSNRDLIMIIEKWEDFLNLS